MEATVDAEDAACARGTEVEIGEGVVDAAAGALRIKGEAVAVGVVWRSWW